MRATLEPVEHSRLSWITRAYSHNGDPMELVPGDVAALLTFAPPADDVLALGRLLSYLAVSSTENTVALDDTIWTTLWVPDSTAGVALCRAAHAQGLIEYTREPGTRPFARLTDVGRGLAERNQRHFMDEDLALADRVRLLQGLRTP